MGNYANPAQQCKLLKENVREALRKQGFSCLKDRLDEMGDIMKFDVYKLADKYKLTNTETQILKYILENNQQVLHMAVREVANINFVSAATIIKLSKKMGYTGYTDMIYRLNFMMTSRRKNKERMSDITSFINDIPVEILRDFMEHLKMHKNHIILVSATGFSSPLAEYMERKLLVTGFRIIRTNAYAVYDKNCLDASLVIVVSKSGETDTIVKLVDYANENHMAVLSFTGEQSNYIGRRSTVNIPILDDKTLDDRNLQSNYFYARVIVVFEYLMSQVLEELD